MFVQYQHLCVQHLVLIDKLYEASNAGVSIQLQIRGICSLIPGVKGMSSNIEAISIVDNYLEHSRIFIFGNENDPEVFISSADFMTRNIDGRVEVNIIFIINIMIKLMKFHYQRKKLEKERTMYVGKF